MSNPLSNPDTLNLNPDWQYEDDLVCDYEQYTLQDVLEEFEGVTQRQIEAVVAYGDKREAVGVDRAARLALEVDKDVLYGDDENVRTAVSNAILTLSPDPSYLDQVRNEAATAALEQERKRILAALPVGLGPIDKDDVIAAIGNDKGQGLESLHGKSRTSTTETPGRKTTSTS